MRWTLAVFAGLFMVMSPVEAGADRLAGHWNVRIYERGQPLQFWILKLENKDGKLDGALITAKKFPPSTLHNPKLDKQALTFSVEFGGRTVDFVCQVPASGAKTIRGNLRIAGQLLIVELEATKKEVLDEIQEGPLVEFNFEKSKEIVTKKPDDPRVFEATLQLIGMASAKKAASDEVAGWTRAALKSAQAYGTRWSREFTFRVAEKLTTQPGLEKLALATARVASELVGPKDPRVDQIRGLEVLVTALRNSGSKSDELAKLSVRLDQLEHTLYDEYMKTSLPFKPDTFAGRKKPGKRAVLVELFTGAQCPPCVAADLGFDALDKTYKTSEVVLLQYHLHIPRPDALTNIDSELRKDYYGSFVHGTPSIFFNGAPKAGGGGLKQHAEGKYKAYREVIDPLLEEPAAVRLEAKATRTGDKIDIWATVADLKNAGDKMRLRFALVEGWVRYLGSNGLAYHHRVVRAMPGGIDGLALTKDKSEHKTSVQLDELRRGLNKYLDNMNFLRPFPDDQRPFSFRDLHVVAFVQNDATQEVLQAVEVPVK
jgi:hypothetical protein